MFPIKNFPRFFKKFLKQPTYAFRVALKRSFAEIFYKFKKGKAPFPEAITIFLTHRCNLTCKMCGQWGEKGITKKFSSNLIGEELPFDLLKKFIDEVSEFKPNITLFGGEPLLYKDCVNLVRYIKEKKMHCLIITNGSLLEEKVKDLVEAGLDELNVSLDGDKFLHENIRGMVGLFDRISRGLEKLKKIKEESNLKKPLLNIQTTISQYNYLELDKLIDVAKKFKADSLTFHNLIFVSEESLKRQEEIDRLLDNLSVDWRGFLFLPQLDVDILYKKIRKILSENHPFSVDFYPNFSYKELKEYYQNQNYKPKEYPFRCLSPWVVAYIFPDGSVKPCLNFSYSFGNIKEQKFKDIWNSKKAIKFRKILKEKKAFFVCTRCTELFRY